MKIQQDQRQKRGNQKERIDSRDAAQRVLLDIGCCKGLVNVQVGHQKSAEDKKQHDACLPRPLPSSPFHSNVSLLK
jgi:hypothetical protein